MIFAQILEIIALTELASVLCARKFSFIGRIRGSGQDVAKAFGAHSATGNGSNPVQPVGSHWVRCNTSLTYCGTVFGIVCLPDVDSLDI